MAVARHARDLHRGWQRRGQFAQLDLTGLPVDLVPARLGRPPASMTGVKALLIRPDAYVDWASDELAGTAQLEARLARWFER